ncbi:MAG: cupin domain-containing protein [Bacteroidales bacterium]
MGLYFTQGNTTSDISSSTVIYENSSSWEPAGEGVKRQIMGYDNQMMMVKVVFEKGAKGAPHTHPHTQTTYVADGKFEFDIKGEKYIVAAGDGLLIEPDALHGCVCLEAGTLIDCFAPTRTDFLK